MYSMVLRRVLRRRMRTLGQLPAPGQGCRGWAPVWLQAARAGAGGVRRRGELTGCGGAGGGGRPAAAPGHEHARRRGCPEGWNAVDGQCAKARSSHRSRKASLYARMAAACITLGARLIHTRSGLYCDVQSASPYFCDAVDHDREGRCTARRFRRRGHAELGGCGQTRRPESCRPVRIACSSQHRSACIWLGRYDAPVPL